MERQPPKALTDFRAERGLTPAALAQFLGEPRPTVHRWLTGERRIGRKKLGPISEKTGIPKRDLRPDLAELLGEG